MPGGCIPAVLGNEVLFRDGVPVAKEISPGAVGA
jgi:hypothetical protein